MRSLCLNPQLNLSTVHLALAVTCDPSAGKEACSVVWVLGAQAVRE